MAVGPYHINGPALVYVGTGSSGALELLGFTKDGVDVRVTEHSKTIQTDLFGGDEGPPQDMQIFGQSAVLNIPLIASDRTVLTKVESRGDRTAAGQISTPGTVAGGGVAVGTAGNIYFACAFTSAADTPWKFAACYLKPDFNTRLGSVIAPFVLQLIAIPYALVTVTTGKDALLYTRTTVP
jgi:hypothetical protein